MDRLWSIGVGVGTVDVLRGPAVGCLCSVLGAVVFPTATVATRRFGASARFSAVASCALQPQHPDRRLPRKRPYPSRSRPLPVPGAAVLDAIRTCLPCIISPPVSGRQDERSPIVSTDDILTNGAVLNNRVTNPETCSDRRSSSAGMKPLTV